MLRMSQSQSQEHCIPSTGSQESLFPFQLLEAPLILHLWPHLRALMTTLGLPAWVIL
jgi:hypothetical protein